MTPTACRAIDEALDDLRAGRMIVLVDDEHRENEGDLVMAAEAVTPAAVNFMIRHACGRLCVAMTRADADRLGLDLLPGVHLDPDGHPVHPQLRRPPRHHHRHLGPRPLPHASGSAPTPRAARTTWSGTRGTWTA